MSRAAQKARERDRDEYRPARRAAALARTDRALPRHRRRQICGDRRGRHRALRHRGARPVSRPLAAGAAAGLDRGSLRDLQARQRTPDRAGAAGRQHRPGRRPDPASWRGRGLDAADGQDPRHRHRLQHHDLRGRRGAADRAAARRRGRPAVSAVARRRRKLHHRRQSLHQCRRHRGAGLWRGARDGARAGSGAGRRPHSERAVEAEKGQHRLRSAQPLHRRRRHARHHHRGDAETVSEAARGRDRLCRPEIAGAGAEAAGDLAERGRRHPHQFRTAVRHRGRFQRAPRHRHPRSAWRTSIPGTC